MPALTTEAHNRLVRAAYLSRGYTEAESTDAVKLCESAARHGIKTHNAIKALHLDDHFGSKTGGCVPGAEIDVLPTRFDATQIWNANRKLGQSVAYSAMETCIQLAEKHGTGTVAVDNAFHYLWGGGYVIDAAKRGYIAYTNCTSAMSEVVPLGGKFPTLGTNPHSWALPTVDAVGFPICLDWATSTVAMGRVQQLLREGKELPPNAAVDADGQPTNDPAKAKWLLPFGAHKGYGLALLNELYAAFIGGSLPTLRGRPDISPAGEKTSAAFFFHVIHPEAISGGAFALGRNQKANLKAVLTDILGHGNENCMLPGQPEANAAKASDEAGGLIFTDAELREFDTLAESIGMTNWR
ncbi:MAG: Ldh family oxidoreductase [Verrucomicrobiales bacterium]